MSNTRDKYLFILLNIVCWVVCVLLCFFIIPHQEKPDFIGYLLRSSVPISMGFIFYFNTLWLLPYACKKRKKHIYYLGNVSMIIVLAMVIHICMLLIANRETSSSQMYIQGSWDHLAYILRKMPVLALSTCIATLIYLSFRWNAMEMAKQKAVIAQQEEEVKRKDAEARQAAAELQALQTQISPHVMLNTLNNIYALIDFDKEKAQHTVVSLSKVLGSMLYTRLETAINLKDEVVFLNHFIDLMKIRLTDNVKVDVDFRLPEPCSLKITPFIFVSLIENAFKYGVSAVEPSFVKISLTADQEAIIFSVSNSYHPTNNETTSGHGIGLEQVGKRLELIYPGRYKWEKGYDEKKYIYTSNIIIYDTDMCHY